MGSALTQHEINTIENLVAEHGGEVDDAIAAFEHFFKKQGIPIERFAASYALEDSANEAYYIDSNSDNAEEKQQPETPEDNSLKPNAEEKPHLQTNRGSKQFGDYLNDWLINIQKNREKVGLDASPKSVRECFLEETGLVGKITHDQLNALTTKEDNGIYLTAPDVNLCEYLILEIKKSDNVYARTPCLLSSARTSRDAAEDFIISSDLPQQSESFQPYYINEKSRECDGVIDFIYHKDTPTNSSPEKDFTLFALVNLLAKDEGLSMTELGRSLEIARLNEKLTPDAHHRLNGEDRQKLFSWVENMYTKPKYQPVKHRLPSQELLNSMLDEFLLPMHNPASITNALTLMHFLCASQKTSLHNLSKELDTRPLGVYLNPNQNKTINSREATVILEWINQSLENPLFDHTRDQLPTIAQAEKMLDKKTLESALESRATSITGASPAVTANTDRSSDL